MHVCVWGGESEASAIKLVQGAFCYSSWPYLETNEGRFKGAGSLMSTGDCHMSTGYGHMNWISLASLVQYTAGLSELDVD